MNFFSQLTPMWVMILAVTILYIVYYVYYKGGLTKEGMEDGLDTSSRNGIGGNSEEFATSIHDKVVQIQDSLLTTKYAGNYENVIIGMDELVDNLMLKTVLSIDPTSPHKNLNH